MFINWLKRKLGYHVCDEFTQWETRITMYSRPVTLGDGIVHTTDIKWTERWQERRCTICGKIQQRKLDN